MKIVFPYIAQPHQIPHSFPLAAELASRPDFEVHIACSTDAQESLVRRLMALYPDARLHVDRLRVNWLARQLKHFFDEGLPPKGFVLASNRQYFRQFRAAIVPERTSLWLRHFRLPDLKLIWTNHGAPGRAINYAADIRHFDFVMLSGQTQRERMLAEGLIREGAYHVGCYAKFDLVQRLAVRPPKLFDAPRPTVLYNPHFEAGLSSWPKLGFEVLDWFAQSRDYNLIFAPHIRLFDHQREALHRQLDRYRQLPHVLIDTGSTRSVDMSYTQAADIYLGDVSSQVCEFLVQPRPCVFLDAHGVAWQHSPDYLFWHLGPVLRDVAALPAALAAAMAGHGQWLAAQRAFVCDSFSTHFDAEGRAGAGDSAVAGADAIAAYLQRAA
ncbi:MAG: sensor domain-containing protein [Pseudomonadota bacterium]